MPDNYSRYKVVDGAKLSETHRKLLLPGEIAEDREGVRHRLPRFFYEIPDWQSAIEWEITEHFGLYEFMMHDVREAPELHAFPRYVPTAITLIASALEVFRQRIGKAIHIAANGGYRSPVHGYNKGASVHSWGTAANIFKIGDELLDDEETIDKYASIAKKSVGGIWTRPFGHEIGEADDHLHLDLGFVTMTPRGYSSE